MGADDQEAPPMVEFIHFLYLLKAPQEPAHRVEPFQFKVVCPGTALEGKGGTERVHFPLGKGSQEIVIGDVLPWSANQDLGKLSVDHVGMGQAPV